MFDLADLISEDLGEPEQRGNRLYWPCPFHADDTPSLTLTPSGKRWKCFGCKLAGGAVSWMMKKRGLDEPEAYKQAEEMGLADGWDHVPRIPDARGRPGGRKRASPRQSTPRPAPVAPRNAQGPPAAWSGRAADFVSYAQEQLWGEAGKAALEYLHGRGLEDDTIRTWSLGWNSADRWDKPDRWGLEPGKKVWLPRGVVIPCEVDGATWYVKVRRFDAGGPLGKGQKYAQPRGGRPALYGLDHLDGRRAVVICEGELDAILLHQEAGDLADVVAIGSKSAHPALPFLARLAGAARWLVALDGDADEAAGWWGEYTARVRRVRPLQGNDLTDFHQAGGNLRAWVEYHLGRLLVTRPVSEGHAPFPLDELEALLAEMKAATGSSDERAEALMARWNIVNAPYDAYSRFAGME